MKAKYKLIGYVVVILSSILLVGTFNIINVDKAWKNTDNLYEHPLKVSNAVRDIKTNVARLELATKDIVLAETDAEFDLAIQNASTAEQKVYKAFMVLNERYLGSDSIITAAFNSFKEWKTIRDRVIELHLSNQDDEALFIANNRASDMVEILYNDMRLMQEFANRKSEEFYNSSKASHDTLEWFTYLLMALSIVVVVFVFVHLRNATIQPIILEKNQLQVLLNERKEKEKALRESMHDVEERVKELQCLYRLSEATVSGNKSIQEVLDVLIEAIPPGWQYPEITCCAVYFNDIYMSSSNFQVSRWKQETPIAVHGQQVGRIEIYYLEDRPAMDYGPFMMEEKKLLEALSAMIGTYYERISAMENLKSINENLETTVQKRTVELQHRSEELAAQVIQVQEAESQFRNLLETAPDAMIIANESGEIVLANAQVSAVFGYQKEELIGQKVELLIPQNFRERHLAHRKDYVKKPAVRKMMSGLSLSALRKNGEVFPAEISISPLRSHDGMLISTSIRDVTERKLAQEKLEASRKELELKTTQIIDSINYAQRIQEAILPPDSMLKQYFGKHFLYYAPKDIVAGDFYWVDQIGDKTLIAVADCTGHGVPGAMVSVICSYALSNAISQYQLTQPAEILDKTAELVEERLINKKDEVHDGMDLALCSLDYKSMTLQFAGANNPLYIIRKDQEEADIEIYKGNSQAIGRLDNRVAYDQHEVQVSKGDRIYLFTDGYRDQFGGPANKKFMSKRFKSMLSEFQHLTISEQLKEIKRIHRDWKGDNEQVDDICIFGLEI